MGAAVHADFIEFLVEKDCVAADAGAALDVPDPQGGHSVLRRLWKLTDLSAGDFADEVARYHELPRIELPALMAARSCADRFTGRFLREMAVFPYLADDGCPMLALADPRDESAIRAAEIVLGEPVSITVASFDDIGTILNERLGNNAATETIEASYARADDKT